MEEINPVEVANLCAAGVKGYNEMNGRIYAIDGASTAIRANSGGHNEIKIAIPQATKKGYIECEAGGVVDLSYPNSKTRRGRVQEGGSVSPTITAESNGIHRIESQYRVRKLTPKECWRLMGFSDEDFIKAKYGGETPVELYKRIAQRDLTRAEWKTLWRYLRHEQVSNSQLYKQAGNSIVVDVLMAIFKEML